MVTRRIRSILTEAGQTHQALLGDEALLKTLAEVVDATVAVFRWGRKVLLCGNGGSAADAQHIAAELSGRYLIERKALYAEALHVNTSHLTAVGNDYGFEQVYARMVEAKGREGDLLICLSTSGNSGNILRAANTAKELGLQTVAMTGSSGGKLSPICDMALKVPSDATPRIQECHILLGHIICELVEQELFG